MTTLHITVGDREQVREDALQFVQAAETDTLDDQDGAATLQFGTYDDLVDSLTPLRLEPFDPEAVHLIRCTWGSILIHATFRTDPARDPIESSLSQSTLIRR